MIHTILRVTMKNFRKDNLLSWIVVLSILGALPQVRAEDIDIFTSAGTTSTVTAPNVMIVLDNSTSDLFGAKIDAISAVIDKIGKVNVGLAMYKSAGTPAGAYIRIAPADVSVPANLTAIRNVLAAIKAGNEFNGKKDEPEAFYEMYKYYTGLAPYAGNDPKTDATVINSTTKKYSPPTLPICGNDYVIYIAANNSLDATVQGKQIYEASVGSAGPSLPVVDTYWGNEWTHFMYAQKDPQIQTYVIDAASPGNSDSGYSKILQATAAQGGGTWQYAGTQQQVLDALLKVFGQIQAVNTTYASVSLPVNTTNRAQDKNQVFIPQFRPDPKAKPRWYGNLKQYQLILQGSSVVLADKDGVAAVNPGTGFLDACSNSFWTTDSKNYTGTDAYWKNVYTSTANACLGVAEKFSDSPDGPIVERGGVAEVLRKGNDAAAALPTWKVKRNIYTQPLGGGPFAAFSSTSPGLDTATGLTSTNLAALVNFVSGQDTNLEEMAGRTDTTLTRPSIHGDAVHSRPLPVDYGGTTGVTVFYGSNDGMFRAVNSLTGEERWALIAPEFYSRLKRLKDNASTDTTQLVSYPGSTAGTPKDYFFDGSIGVYQNLTSSKVWIYPSMRRGGRMVYGLDVTNPAAAPTFKWKVGCTDNSTTGCTSSAFNDIGQTWSQPSVTASILGYTDTSTLAYKPVVIFGGGYDTCEDLDTPVCPTPKGGAVFVVDADTGVLVKKLTIAGMRSVAADVALVAISKPGIVDHAYAVDTGGGVYRIDFDANIVNWKISKVGGTSGGGRKFLYPPAVLPAPSNQVYLAFGSGDREHPLKSSTATFAVENRFYVLKDDLTKTISVDLDDTTSPTALMCDYTTSTACGAPGIYPNSLKSGWFIKLPGAGEKAVTSAAIISGLVTFSTNMPTPPSTTPKAACTPDLGVASGYFLNLFNASGAIGVTGSSGGARSSIFVGGGLPPSPVFATVPIGGRPRTLLIGAIQRNGSSSSTIAPQLVVPIISQRRKSVYWKSSGMN